MGVFDFDIFIDSSYIKELGLIWNFLNPNNYVEGGFQTEPKRVDMDWYESIEIKNKDISPTISPTNVLFVN